MKHTEIEIKPIRTKKDHERTLKTIESLLDCPPKSKEAGTLEVLSILADEYEQKHFPIDAPDPIEAIKYRMEQLALSQKDLAKYIGVNQGKRSLKQNTASYD